MKGNTIALENELQNNLNSFKKLIEELELAYSYDNDNIPMSIPYSILDARINKIKTFKNFCDSVKKDLENIQKEKNKEDNNKNINNEKKVDNYKKKKCSIV